MAERCDMTRPSGCLRKPSDGRRSFPALFLSSLTLTLMILLTLGDLAVLRRCRGPQVHQQNLKASKSAMRICASSHQ